MNRERQQGIPIREWKGKTNPRKKEMRIKHDNEFKVQSQQHIKSKKKLKQVYTHNDTVIRNNLVEMCTATSESVKYHGKLPHTLGVTFAEQKSQNEKTEVTLQYSDKTDKKGINLQNFNSDFVSRVKLGLCINTESKEEPKLYVQMDGYKSDSDNDNENSGLYSKKAFHLPTLTSKDVLQRTVTHPFPFNDKYHHVIWGCRYVEEFSNLGTIEDSTFGTVYRARDKSTGETVALKKLKIEEKEGFPISSLREIGIMLKTRHPNIITLREVVVGNTNNSVYIVMEYMEHDINSLMQSMEHPFLIGEVKTLMSQLLSGMAYLHDNWIIHRDLKTSNLLISSEGVLKIADFGLAREFGSPLKQYTPVVVTLWYRSPELLLGIKKYSTAVDMWSVGCIFAEFLLMRPLWMGKSEIDELRLIFKDLGTPNEKIWPGVTELPVMKTCNFTRYPYNTLRCRFEIMLTDTGFDLLNRLLTFCPSKRMSAAAAMKHHYFKECPLPVDPAMFKIWLSKYKQPCSQIPSRNLPDKRREFSIRF